MKVRDSQLSKLFRAEHEALENLGSALPAVSDIQEYLSKHSQSAPLRRRYGDAVDVIEWDLQVADGRGRRYPAAHGTDSIVIPRWARQDWIVLHQWAHIVHRRLNVDLWGWLSTPVLYEVAHGSRRKELQGGAEHGWQFAAIYLDLVRFCMGKEAAAALEASFKAHRVRYRPKRTATGNIRNFRGFGAKTASLHA